LRSEGKTIFFCSHYLAEVETLCDTIGILRRGQMILSGTVKDLVQAQNVVEIVLADHLTASTVLTTLSLPADSVLSTRQNIITIREETQASVLEQLIHAGIALHSLNPLNRSLEDVYMQATNQADMNVASATQRVRTGEK
jgi:ABC-2 type transport system ATP-binding protein